MNDRQKQLIPPQDLEAEMSLLGTMLLSGGGEAHRLDDVLAIIGRGESAYFYRPDHRKLFDTLVEMHGNDQPMDIVTVEDELRRREDLEAVGGRDYLIDLVNSVPSVANNTFYAHLVKAKGVLRQIIQAGSDMTNAAYEAAANAGEIIEEAELKLLKARGATGGGSCVRIGDVIKKVVAAMESGEPDPGLTTGWPSIDAKLGGMRPGNFVVIAARPSVGKTSWAMQMATHVAETQAPVGVISLEMSATEVTEQILAQRNLVNGRLFRTPADMSDLDRSSIANDAGPARLWIDDSNDLTADEIGTVARTLVSRHGIKLLVIDYLQLIRSEKRGRDSRYEAVTKISRSLKALAGKLSIPVVCLAQLNREAAKENRHPKLSDLRDSGAIEQDADIVAFLAPKEETPPEEARPPHAMTWFLIRKHRRGDLGAILLDFHLPTTTFREA